MALKKMEKPKASDTMRAKKNDNKATEDQKEEKYGGFKSRSAQKREEAAVRKEESNAKRIEARQLAKKEEEDLARAYAAPMASKVKAADLIRRREEEQAALEKRAEEEERRHALIGDDFEIEPNTNHDESIIEARNVDDAIVKLTTSDHTLHAGVHKKKMIKVSFKVFEKEEIARLKEEKPGLSLSQYKDMVLKLLHRLYKSDLV